MALQLVHITDKGATRPSNQDSFCARISNFGRETIAMLAVCDGVGGLQSGELASTGAVRCFEEWFEQQLPEIVQNGLTADVVFFSWHRMLETLHTALCSYSGKTGIQLGTTVSALLLTRDDLYQVQVGDSRIYLDDGLGLVQLSKDQTLARLLAQYWLCQAPEGEKRPCGVCRACQQVRDGTHADLVIIAPGKPISPDVRPDMKSIPVDEIRALIAITGRHTFEGGRRVVLIEQADKMNPPAQNALLKTLEEPVPGTIFLLMTESPSLLLPTIVSRCRELKLHPWDDRTVLSVLEKHGVTGQRAQEALHVSGGSIGKALAVAGDEQYWQRRSEVMRDFFALERRSDILRISSTWKDRKDDAEELLDDVEDMLRTLLLCHLGQRSESAVTPYPAAWQRFSREGELSAMMRLLDAVAQARQMRANQVTWQAVVERLLLSLMEEKSKWST